MLMIQALILCVIAVSLGVLIAGIFSHEASDEGDFLR